MEKLKEKIKLLSSDYLKEIIHLRQYLHQHPELSFEEYKTSALIKKKLEEFNIETSLLAGTGVVGVLRGKNPESKTIALRADMDALPILEQNHVSYKSVNEGVMHACGHDVHSASLLGAAKILGEIRNEFEGTIKFVFQPGEEKLPGGASLMIEQGVLENPAPESIFAQHVYPSMEAGKVGFKSGMYMASTDEVYITVKGKGGHGAMPHLNIDPVVISAHLIIAMQQLVSRNANPITPTVLSFGKVIANGATNVIPNEVKLEGTFRTMDELWRNQAHEKIKALAKSLTESMGGTCEVNILKGYPFLVNDQVLTEKAKQNAEDYLGKQNVEELDIRMTAEDFAFFSQKMPACFYRLGTGNRSKNIVSPVHTDTFNIDESALEIGMGLMAWLTLCELKREI